MTTFTPTSVDDPVAEQLLTEYFEYRAAGFPVPGGYRTTRPASASFVLPRGVFVVARRDEEPLGCGGVRMLDAHRAEVKHLWVRAAGRGKGLGRELLAELERRARTLGATEIVLDTNASLEAAGGLYRSSGYEPVPAYNDNPNADAWYRKRL